MLLYAGIETRALFGERELNSSQNEVVQVGLTQNVYIGQRLVVNFTHNATLCFVEANKSHYIVYMCNHRVNTYRGLSSRQKRNVFV